MRYGLNFGCSAIPSHLVHGRVRLRKRSPLNEPVMLVGCADNARDVFHMIAQANNGKRRIYCFNHRLGWVCGPSDIAGEWTFIYVG